MNAWISGPVMALLANSAWIVGMRGWVVGALGMVAVGVAQAEVTFVAEYEGKIGGMNIESYSITIENLTETTIAEFRSELEFITPGRSVPWAVQRQRSPIAGGVEPGETRVLSSYMAPSGVSQADGQEVVINVLDVQFFDPDGSVIE